MLTLHSGISHRDCAGLSRRSFLRAGMLGLGSLTLPWLLEAKARAGAAGEEGSFVKDKAIVLIFLGGGASHIETFNPNMDAPEPSRSVTGEVKTPLPGVTLGGTFPMLAEHARNTGGKPIRSFTMANIASALYGMATGALLFSSVLFLRDVWDYSIVASGSDANFRSSDFLSRYRWIALVMPPS